MPLDDEQAEQAIRAVFSVLVEAISRGETEHVLGQLGSDYTRLVGMTTGARAGSS